MHAVMRYTVKADQLQDHLDLLHDVYTDLATRRPAALAWTTYRVNGTNDFIELVEGPDLPRPLPELASFQRYRAGLDDRCESHREFLEVHPIGTYLPSPS